MRLWAKITRFGEFCRKHSCMGSFKLPTTTSHSGTSDQLCEIKKNKKIQHSSCPNPYIQRLSSHSRSSKCFVACRARGCRVGHVRPILWLRLPGAQPIFSSLATKITKEWNHWDLQILTEQFWSIPIFINFWCSKYYETILEAFWSPDFGSNCPTLFCSEWRLQLCDGQRWTDPRSMALAALGVAEQCGLGAFDSLGFRWSWLRLAVGRMAWIVNNDE